MWLLSRCTSFCVYVSSVHQQECKLQLKGFCCCVVVDVGFKQCGTTQSTAFSVMLLKVQDFWDVILCCKASHSPCSKGASCLHLQPDPEGEGAVILLKHWELYAQEQCHIPEDMIL
jgi:hypothetical protein